MARRRKIFGLALLAALGAWLVRRRKSGAPAPEGVWRDAGSTDGWGDSGSR